MPPSSLEQAEKLEQLRALEAGMKIGVAVVNEFARGIDTPDDLDAFRQRIEAANQSD
jgi:3-deoxy-manno-octulosonate cytidylyltransferase (CMP-KDO synthetase)